MPSCVAVCNGVRHTVSLFLTLGSLGLIFYCVAMDYAALPGPPWLHYLLFIFSITLLAYLEGLQVAILSLEHLSYIFPDPSSSCTCIAQTCYWAVWSECPALFGWTSIFCCIRSIFVCSAHDISWFTKERNARVVVHCYY